MRFPIFKASGPYSLLLFSLLCSLTQGRAGLTPRDEGRPFHFVTRPDISAFKWNIDIYDHDALAPGYWFIAPYQELDQKKRGKGWVGPYIYDSNGDLIWSGQPIFDSFNIFDFRPTVINGENMLTAVYPREKIGIIMDSSYRIWKTVKWLVPDTNLDVHEFNVFDDGKKALVVTREDHRVSGEAVGYDGECYVHTSGILELDITTSPPTTLFNFSLIDHFSLDEITFPFDRDVDKECRTGWDASHCNAIDRFSNGDLLVSCRHMNSLLKISRSTGNILWRLGGTKSDFKLAGEDIFSRQHHARVLEDNSTHTLVTLFDNARSENLKAATHEYTRGLILSLHDGVAERVAEYPRPDRGFSTSRGSMEVLPNGNVFMGWTFKSYISEHAPDGTVLMEGSIADKMNTYRSHKMPWIGRPSEPPNVFARTTMNRATNSTATNVYASWNGATEVKRWDFYGGSSSQQDKMALLDSVTKNGFETYSRLDGTIPYVIAVAIDAGGNTLGQSKSVQSTPSDRKPQSFIEEQEWLHRYSPAVTPSAIQETNPYDDDDPRSWRQAVSLQDRSIWLAYVGGLCTSIVLVIVWGVVRCVRRNARKRRQVERYTPIDGEYHEDDYELDEGVKEVDRG